MIRIAIIGMGQRGKATLQRLQNIPEAEVVVVCDRETDWHTVAERDDIHLIYICTPWDCHVEMAVEAMKQGKHVAVEVPAAMTVAECELLVRIARWTERHCVMLENCCYDTWHLGARAMVQQGLLGTVTHLEGAYLHAVDADWMIDLRRRYQGNPYPTHGFGPMCQLLPEGDRPESLVSMSAHNGLTGDNLNDTLLRTKQGITMLLQYDVSTPRPYNRLQTVCGTEGFLQKYPLPTVCIKAEHLPVGLRETLDLHCNADQFTITGQQAESLVEAFIPQDYQSIIAEGRRLGVPNVMNYTMDRRLIDVLLQEQQSGTTLPLDMDVREAALWSSITELTERSAKANGERVNIPDF